MACKVKQKINVYLNKEFIKKDDKKIHVKTN